MTDPHHVEQVLTILEEATEISGKVYPTDAVAFPSGIPILPGAGVKFPDGRVIAPDRVGMWVDEGDLCMSIWPCELQPQSIPPGRHTTTRAFRAPADANLPVVEVRVPFLDMVDRHRSWPRSRKRWNRSAELEKVQTGPR